MTRVESWRKAEITMGRRIASRRVLLGWSQGDLAARLKVTPAAVSLYEADQRHPKLPVLAAMAAALGVSIDWIIRGDAAAA